MSDYSRPYDGKLYIYYLKQQDAGDYECYLQNGQSERVRLTVGDKQHEDHQEPAPEENAEERVQEENYDKEVQFNTIVELSCKFSESHPKNLRWRRVDGVS